MGLTTTEFIDELKKSLGNRTDISDERYVRWLNWAILDICGFHKKKFLHPIRFHELEDTIMFKATVHEGTVDTSTDSTINITGSDIVGSAGYYVDNVVKVNGEEHLVVGWDGTQLTIVDRWNNNPSSGDGVTLHSRSFSIEDKVGISPKESLWLIEQMEKAVSGDEIEQKDWNDLIFTAMDTVGDPSSFARHSGDVVFDIPIEEDKSYRLYVYMFPTMLDTSLPNQESILPDTFDELIVLGAMHRGFDKLMEPERSKMALDKYQLELYNHQTAYFQEDKYISKQVKLRRH